MAKTMTKVQKFTAIAKALEGTQLEGFDAQEFLKGEITAVEKKNKRKSATPSKTQKENVVIKAKILETLTNTEDGMTATEIAKTLGLSSPQKASALVHQLIDEDKAKSDKVGKAVVFTAVA